jgi:hypothetical protein
VPVSTSFLKINVCRLTLWFLAITAYTFGTVASAEHHEHHEHAHDGACDHHDPAPPPADDHSGCDHGPGESDSPHHPAIDIGEESGVHFHPYMDAAIALGGSTSEKNLDLVAGGHAPIDDGFNLQGIELGSLVEFGPNVAIRASGNVFWDRFDGWDAEWEEVFAQIDLPADWRLRGGRFLVPFGRENSLHLHDRAFVEAPISMIRMLGEEGLYTDGAEVIAPLGGDWSLTIGVGHGTSHSHGSNDREARRDAYLEALEHAAEHDHDDAEVEEEEEHHAHGRAGLGGVYDPDAGYLEDELAHARISGSFGPDQAWQAGFSAAFGHNAGGLDTWIIGADISRKFELADRPAWWRSEAWLGRYEARDTTGAEGQYDLSGIYAALGWEFAEDWIIAARAEWSSGNRMAGLERRWRLAANIGRTLDFAPAGDAHVRLQYTYDELGGYGEDHTVWLQCVLNLGAAHHGHEH